MKENIFATTLVEKLKLNEKFSQIVPMTMHGKQIYEKYSNLLKEHGPCVSLYHNFMIESMGTTDNVLENWSRVNSDLISKECPNCWKLNMILEKLSRTGGSLNETLIDDMNYLTTYSETDLCEAIAKGALKDCLINSDIIALHESITGEKHALRLSESNVMYNPVSFIESKNGNSYLMIEGRIYMDSKTGLQVAAKAPSRLFEEVNAAIQQIPYNPDVDEFELTFLPGAVNVTSNGNISLNKKEVTLDDLKDVIEQSLENQKESVKMEESRKFDMISKICENFSNVVKLDNVSAIKNTINNSAIYLYEHSLTNYIITNNGISQSTKSLNEAVSIINKYSGVNLRSVFNKRLNEEFKTMNESSEINSKYDEKILECETQINSIKEELEFTVPGSKKNIELKAILEDANDILDALRKSKIML